ncbi:S9 family peptidase [Flagellimonas zhangzhouensis]|uniref:Acylaminoacyl-peptidase n=1 Tax=Flagellimonas zhangzhouensis TaxID=1073328 RepID=A0A1H2RSQ2_9FLAO|nr:S9 family peptidase [Allomuricauda zhangzhouensis]SDQ67389.1 acylaminoacyl-peptidase [Allomuricauda zhangzhouensis]SDW22441.1 acylaminoacyl-peptidase [Allomuricauda zhangzhouensis]
MKKLVATLLLFVAIIPLGFSQVQSNLELLDIFNMEYVSDPQISPDGSKIIYVRNFKDVMTDRNLSNLWIINFDGSNNRPLTTGNHNDFSPKWSHDGTKIVFKSNMADDKMKLYLMWLDTKETMALTNTPQSPGQVSWSYDDTTLAFNMFVPEANKSIIKMPAKPEGAKWNDPPKYIDKMNYRGDGAGYYKGGNTQLFTLPISGGTPKQLTFTEFEHGGPIWAKDNTHLYFNANFHKDEEMEPADSEIYKISTVDGKITPLTDRYGPDAHPVLSPDGSKIAYLGYDDKLQGYQLTQLYVINVDGTDSKLISGDFDRDVEDMVWNSKGNGFYFIYTDQGIGKLASMSLSGNVSEITDGLGGLSLGRPYNAASFSASSNNKFAYTIGDTSHPSDLGAADSKSTKRLTAVNDDLFAFKKLGKVEEMWWESSYDQRKIQGWVVTPPDFDPSKKYPMILEIHGGPFTSYGAVYSAEIQAYAAAGYVVLYTNPRGSTSYGEEFGNLIHHDYPNHDYEDLMSGVDALLEKGYVDTENLYVTGGSGGGVLTAWIVGKTDRFKAAVVAKPVINWTSFVLYADGVQFFSKYWFGKKPWEDPENYFRRSPLNYVGNVTTPTMLLTGEEDYRTPIAESEQFYAALKLENVETAMVRIPGAGHGIANKPSNLIAKIAAVLAWFEKYKGE